jgi:preprotein translocase subunit SecE
LNGLRLEEIPAVAPDRALERQMKLFEKKEDGPNKKVQSIETARKAANKPAVVKPAVSKSAAPKPARAKKTEITKKTVKKPGETSMAWVNTTRDYLREVIVELKKVIWPSRKETVGSTAVVLVIVGMAAVFLGFVDLILSRLVKLLVG